MISKTGLLFMGRTITLATIALLMIFTTFSYGQSAGLVPQNSDGFETGDWRNFRPHYIGDSDQFIRPNFSINDTNPISGKYSLQWKADDLDHKWVKVSNAFYLDLPAKISMDFQVEAPGTGWSIGLRLLETHERYAGVRFGPVRDGKFNVFLEDLTGAESEVVAEIGNTFRMILQRNTHDDLKATLIDVSTGNVIAELKGLSSVAPEALGIYVYTGAGSEAVINFDDVTVETAPYRLRSGEWVRSPHFVVLPQLPDVEEDQGNWVGAQTTMKKDGRYLMWYRMRDNIRRGRGYSFAQSSDGIHWERYENPPIFTYNPDRYSSAEKITVLFVDGLYRAWYAVNMPMVSYDENIAPNSWYTSYATSEDGLNWDKHGLVISDTYTKDADVIYLDGTYYLYAIRDNDNVSVHTSQDGVNWELRNTISMGAHRHVAATYVEKTGKFHLYITGGFAGVSGAVSKDGINFGPFRQVMASSSVGLDDWADAGVTYLSFLTDEHGTIKDDRQMPIYYQARNTWDNNIPGWLFHGSERVVLAGHFDGIFPGVTTTVLPEGGYEYHSFPFEVPRAEGIEMFASQRIDVSPGEWAPNEMVLFEGTIESKQSAGGHSGIIHTQVQWELSKLSPGDNIELVINGEPVANQQADPDGYLVLTAVIAGDEGLVKYAIKRLE